MKETYKHIIRKYNTEGKLTEEIEETTTKEYEDKERPFFTPYIPITTPSLPYYNYDQGTTKTLGEELNHKFGFIGGTNQCSLINTEKS